MVYIYHNRMYRFDVLFGLWSRMCVCADQKLCKCMRLFCVNWWVETDKPELMRDDCMTFAFVHCTRVHVHLDNMYIFFFLLLEAACCEWIILRIILSCFCLSSLSLAAIIRAYWFWLWSSYSSIASYGSHFQCRDVVGFE